MNDTAAIMDDSVLHRRKDLIAAESDGEMVVLDAERGDFLQLNSSAARIWALLEEPLTLAALCARLAEQFATGADECRGDVLAFLDLLRERGMIEIGAPRGH
ncbi:MAG: HPr-rel-A system PqqD family peptide chaperone [Sphingomonas sp.]|jgi:PqqD family protein of HPr-rel-A system|uniref:HPr-rel-A system PqqD family peptide chaperone n=1 Tax=Sphingomonas sp. TaxID=28214 RepID=UPI00356A9A01